MATAFIIHGLEGSAYENWIPWLRTKLEADNLEVHVPQFPTPKGHNLNNWLKVLQGYRSYITQESFFIAYSMGVAFVLSALEILNIQPRACFFIAGWTGKLNDPEVDHLNKTFCERTFNWEKIQTNCKKYYIFNADNDPYVPLQLGVGLAANLHTTMITVPNAGHFNTKAGYTEFPLLLSHIQKELSSTN